KQNSRGTSIVSASSARCLMTTGVPLNHEVSHCRSNARLTGAAARWSRVGGGSGAGAGAAGAALVGPPGGALVQPARASEKTSVGMRIRTDSDASVEVGADMDRTE